MINFEKLAIASVIEGKLKVTDLAVDMFTSRNPRFIYKLIKAYQEKYSSLPSIEVIQATINTQIEPEKAKIYCGYVDGLPEGVTESPEAVLDGLKEDRGIKLLDSKIEELVGLVADRDLVKTRGLLKELLVSTSDVEHKVVNANEAEFSVDNIMMLDSCISDVTNKLQGVTLISAKSGCVDKDTEYLTRTGWKKFSDYVEGDEVLQWSEGGATEFIEPIRYIKLPYDKMYHFKSKWVDMVVSEEHRVPYVARENLLIKTGKEFADAVSTRPFTVTLPTMFSTPSNTKGIPLTDAQIRVMVAFIADGHIPKVSMKTGWGRVNLKKNTKKERLERLLQEANIPYRKVVGATEGYHTYNFTIPIITKSFDSFWCATKEQLAVIVDEVPYWDGSFDPRGNDSVSFYSTDKGNTDFIQYAFTTIRNRVSTINIDDRVGQTYMTGGKEYIRKSISYEVLGTSFMGRTTTNLTVSDFVPTDGFMYCFEVPSSFFIARRNNSIFVTGNCGKSVMAMNQALHSYKQGNDVLYINLELSQNEAMARMLACELHVPFQDIYTDLDEREVTYYNNKKAEVFSRPNKFKMVNCGVDAQRIMDLIRDEHTSGLQLVVIDYLQIVENENYDEQWKFLSKFVKDLHRLTLELGICILTPIQINEVTEKNGNVSVTARGAQELNFTASLWFHLHQNEEEAKNNLARMFTIKSRHSQRKTYVLQTDFEHMKFHATGLFL